MIDYNIAEPTFIDLETTIRNRGEDAVGDMQASPYSPDNEIVYTGLKVNGVYGIWEGNFPPNPPVGCNLLVAQNIAFDLSWLLQSNSAWSKWVRHGAIWDTMIVEYLLTGQRHKWASLDELAEKYGGTIKDSRIKEYWKAGVDTPDIPKEEIIPYLEYDVSNLEIIYKGQLELANQLHMLPLIQSQMQARLATILMEWNGMQFDKAKAIDMRDKLSHKMRAYEWAVQVGMAHILGCEPEQCNAGSPKQLSACIFGGTVEFVEKLPMLDDDGNPVVFKSGARKGQQKYKNTKVEYSSEGLYKPTSELGAAGYYPVGEGEIKALASKGDEFVEAILNYRELAKQVTTYFDGYASLVFPDGRIHGNLNHCQTATGRLSSSKPNLQNLSNKTSEE